MTNDDLAKQLHERATRGEELSPAEQAHLDAWYARQDEAEAKLLDKGSSAPSATALHGQVNAALARLVTVTQRIQTLADENEALRREIAALQRQLPPTPTAQPV